MDFKTFKQNRSKMAESIQKMRDEKESGGFKKDDSIYFPKIDSKGNAYSVIRFLPQKDMNKHPVVHVYNHKDEIAGKKLSILCPSTFGTMKDCELCGLTGAEYKALKDSGVEFPKVPGYRKKTSLVNILVVKDKTQPEFEGRVMKMYISDTLQKKIDIRLFPPKDENGDLMRASDVVYDLWEGKNFNLVIFKNKQDYNDYTESSFEAESTPVAKTDAEIEAIYNQIYDLMPDKAKMISSKEVLEKWNTFHSINHSASVEKDKPDPKEEFKKNKEETKKLEEAVEAAEAEFSNTEVESTSHDADTDNEPLLW
jgi:hypothetical protein